MPLTEQERNQLTYLDLLAFDIARKEAQDRGAKIPDFLCTSEETKAEYRRRAVAVLNEQVDPIVPFSAEHPAAVEGFIRKMLPNGAGMLARWIAAEEMAQEARADNDPGAFFV